MSFLNEYGVTWDEPLHRNWGKLFLIFIRTGDRRFLDLMAGHGIYYSPLYFFFNYILSEYLYKSGWLAFVPANHVLNLFTASFAASCLFVLAKKIGGLKTGLMAVLTLIFFPMFLAHSHYNPKDIPLMSAVLLTATVFIYGLYSGRRGQIILAAGLYGVAIALKISALSLAPVFALAYLVWAVKQWRTAAGNPHRLKRELITVFLSLIAVSAGLYAAWPTAWGAPDLIPNAIRFFLSVQYWPGEVLFFGKEYSGVALPWYYIPLEYLMATPILILLAFGTGCAVAVRKVFHRDRAAVFLFLLLWFWLPILASMKPGLVRYDGMRQFFFCLPALAILGGIGVSGWFEWLDRKFPAKRWLVPVASCLMLGQLLHEVIIIHPFEGSYRNEIVRMFIPRDIDRQLQIEFWGEPYKQGMDWLLANAEPNPFICVPTADVLVTWYPWRPDFSFECSKRTNYVMFITRYSEIHKFDHLPIPPVFTISRYNSALLKIYKIQ